MDGKFLLIVACGCSTAFAATWLAFSPTGPRPGEIAAVDRQGKALHFSNCDEVRAAGLGPLWAGKPGYTRDLDPDGLGFACPPR